MPDHRSHPLKTDQSLDAEFADICKPAQPDPTPTSTGRESVGETEGCGIKKPGETLSQYVRRRMTEEAHLTDAEIDARFIDGNARDGRAAVVMTLGTGDRTKTKAPMADDKARMPITDMTKADQGAAFLIGVAGNVPPRQAKPRRVPSATSPHKSRASGTKVK